MKKFGRYISLLLYLLGSFITFYILVFILFKSDWPEIITDWSFWATVVLFLGSINEFYNWAKNGKRSELSDLVAIGLFFFFIFFITKELLTSIMGAFSIYLWAGIFELKEYPVINKILIISLVTYNVIFIAGLVSFYLQNPFFINTAFAFSFWIILGLGFLLFGRKYIVVWRFMSPAYLTLFLYIIAWLAVVFINQYTPIKFREFKLLDFDYRKYTIIDFILNIYFILIIVNWIVYLISGPILDKILGIKRINDEDLLNIVEQVKNDIGVKKRVKVGFGKYPILNAMAYGSIFDNRIAIIAEDLNQIPKDEIKGVVAHELAHSNGKHTLILTFIASIDLVLRMLLGLPATYYDYTFGNPQIPMISFITLNLCISLLLYIFVRILEARADLKAKNAGYAKELVKALYNLESFYATGREIGLNTMLLCEERITMENKMLDYMNTAEFIHQALIKPSKLSLLSNFLNSHPLTYHRIAALLSDNLTPFKETLLPFICLKTSKQKEYAKKFAIARTAFKTIANEKFKETFKVANVSALLESLRVKEFYKFDLSKEFLFKNKITNEIILGKLEDVHFIDDICSPEQFFITDLKTNRNYFIDSSNYSKFEIYLNEIYYLKNKLPLKLMGIECIKGGEESNYVFFDKDNNRILKSIKKIKLPNSVRIINDLKDKDTFLKLNGDLKIYRCVQVIPSEKFDEYELSFKNFKDVDKRDEIVFKIRELIISPRNLNLNISNNSNRRKSEIEIIDWLLSNQVLSTIYLKKPVNNIEFGYIQAVNNEVQDLEKGTVFNKLNNKESILVINIFGQEKNFPFSSLEHISFEYNTVTILKKTDTSFFSKLGYLVLKKINPKKIIYLTASS